MDEKIYHVSMVSINGKKITRSNYNSTSNSMYQIGFCTMLITGIVVAKFCQDGILDYDADINEYLKIWKCPYNGITLRLLLSHKSGNLYNINMVGVEKNVMIKQCNKTNIDIINGTETLQPFEVKYTPGEKSVFSPMGYQVIQQVLEEVSGIRMHELMKKYVFRPLGLKNSTGRILYEWKHDYNIINSFGFYILYPETAACGVWMSCNDMATLLIDIFDGLNYDKSKLLSRESIRVMLKGENPEWNEMNNNYGLGALIYQKNGKNLFCGVGITCAYMCHFHCHFDERIINIIMINYDPFYYGLDNPIRDAKKYLKKK